MVSEIIKEPSIWFKAPLPLFQINKAERIISKCVDHTSHQHFFFFLPNLIFMVHHCSVQYKITTTTEMINGPAKCLRQWIQHVIEKLSNINFAMRNKVYHKC